MYDFSLVVATKGRYKELDMLLKSLLNQTVCKETFEVVLVDQNPKGYLDALVHAYSKMGLNILHVHSDLVGVSANRNVGIGLASGDVLTFPDDDCEYYSDTLQIAKELFNKNQIKTLLGRVYDRTNKKNLIRRWPTKNIWVNERNFFWNYSMITVFTKYRDLFDERFGGGARYPAYEDADYTLKLATNSPILYTPTVEILHPQLNFHTMATGKLRDYSKGFGAFAKKNRLFLIFISSLCHNVVRILMQTLKLNFIGAHKLCVSLREKVVSFIDFK